MQSEDIISTLSLQRFETYKRVFSEIVKGHDLYDDYHKIVFYMDVQKLYSHFYIPIQVLEVTLRNRLHDAFCKHYKDEFWFQHLVKESFCSKTTKRIFFSTDRDIKRDFKKDSMKHRELQPADYVGRLTFAFWVELLKANYRKTQFWQFHAQTVFPHKGKTKLGSIDDSLKRAKTIRNRLYHYEPQWKNQRTFLDLNDFCDNLEDKYALIIKIIGFCSLSQKDLLNEYALNFQSDMEQFKRKLNKL